MKLDWIKLIINYIKANKPYQVSLINVLVICFLLSVNSCKKLNKSNQANAKSELSVSVPKVDYAQGPYQATETLKNDLIHTKLEVSFDWTKQYLNGVATLSFKPYFYPQNALVLDAKGMDIHEVVLLPKLENLKFKYDGKVLDISLPKKYSRVDTFTVRIKYTAKPNELPKGGSNAIMSDIGLYFINPLGLEKDKPKQIWTQGETEASSCWFPTIDSPNEKTTQEMFITVDTNFVVLSNGKLISSKSNLNGTKTVCWKQDLPHAPYLFMMAIGEYAVIKDRWKNIEVNYYVEPKYEKYARDIFGQTPAMIDFFSDKLGFNYPWAKYSQVVVRDYVSGAMENTTATIFMEALQSDDRALADENWESIIAHELFHHWFGDLVTCESWSNLPLNESFANYSEYLWAEYKYGVDHADYHGENEAAEYFDEATRKQVPLIRFHYNDKEDMFDRHSYNKGGRILHMLRKYVGDEAFFESLKLYLHRNQYKTVEVHDLRLAFEEVTGQDLNWFFNQWFLSSGHPELKVQNSYSNGILHISVKQLQDTAHSPVYKLPVNVDVWVNGIKTTHLLNIEKLEHDFEIPLLAPPNLVLFDSDFQLLAKIEHDKTIEELIFQYKNYDRYLARKLALTDLFEEELPQFKIKRKGIVVNNENIKNPFDNVQLQEILNSALSDPFWAIRNFALDQFSIHYVGDFAKYLAKIEKMAQEDSKPQVKAKSISLLSSYSNKDYLDIYKKAIYDKPYSVCGAGLSGYLKSGDQSLKLNLEEFEQMNNINIILPLADHYLTTGVKLKYNWFKNSLLNGSPRVIYNMIGLFVKYVQLVDTEQQADAILVLKDIYKNNKYEQIRYQAQLYLDELQKTK